MPPTPARVTSKFPTMTTAAGDESEPHCAGGGGKKNFFFYSRSIRIVDVLRPGGRKRIFFFPLVREGGGKAPLACCCVWAGLIQRGGRRSGVCGGSVGPPTKSAY